MLARLEAGGLSDILPMKDAFALHAETDFAPNRGRGTGGSIWVAMDVKRRLQDIGCSE
jgi:hypothetical protein